jgi:uncharacterized membrane protein
MTETIHTKNGLHLEAPLVYQMFPNNLKVFFIQGRICYTDMNNNEVLSVDLFELYEFMTK